MFPHIRCSINATILNIIAMFVDPKSNCNSVVPLYASMAVVDGDVQLEHISEP